MMLIVFLTLWSGRLSPIRESVKSVAGHKHFLLTGEGVGKKLCICDSQEANMLSVGTP